MELTPKIEAMLGPARPIMVRLAAQKLDSGLTWAEYEEFLPEGFCWKLDLTVWEMRLAELLIEDLREQGGEDGSGIILWPKNRGPVSAGGAFLRAERTFKARSDKWTPQQWEIYLPHVRTTMLGNPGILTRTLEAYAAGKAALLSPPVLAYLKTMQEKIEAEKQAPNPAS